MSEWNDPGLKNLFLNNVPLIDVRAPVEFAAGPLPHSINLPIMNDRERELVGTCYKENGQAAAIKLGHELVTGAVKEARISAWRDYLLQNPEAEIFCFRGGLRSQITCQWLREVGFTKNPLPGGFKRMRRFFLSHLLEAPLPQLIRLGGRTGSGKTKLLAKLPHFIDLEHLASHRGSAFGKKGPQPTPIGFENELALALMRQTGITVVEDESAIIGDLSIPERLFQHMRSSPMIILETDLETRVQIIYDEYVVDAPHSSLQSSLSRIKKRLGGQRFTEIDQEMSRAYEQGQSVDNHRGWITDLLKHYYDPIYERDMDRQSEQIIFRGNETDILSYLKSIL